MENKTKHFLILSLISVCVACIAVFAILALYLNGQNKQTIGEIGNIYMSSMNDRISKHFGSITDHRLSQMKAMTEIVPPECQNDKDALGEWFVYNGEARGYDSLAYCYSDGSMEMIYGAQMVISNPESFIQVMESGTNRIAVGLNGYGERVALVCVPVSFEVSGLEDCIAMVGELPLSYIAETLSLEDDDSLIYSFVIRKDGSFVVRTSAAFRENYFDRVKAVYSEADGKTTDEYIAELKEAMDAGEDYSSMVRVDGEYRHMYASSLPNSVWYLITLMPYGALNESVEALGARSFVAALIGCAVILIVLLLMFRRYFAMSHAQMKELEAAREMAEEAKQAAEAASRSKSEFLSNMSHDIRTPMNGIVGMTAIATAHIEDTEQVRNCLKKITLSSRHLLGLINDVLDMSKIESGKMTLNVEMVSLREVMDSIVSIVQPQVRAKHQHFNVSIFNITSENVYCDSVRLNQVLLNLLSNAIKFTPEDGSVEVMLHEEDSTKGEDYVRVRIHVKDTGIGMSKEFLEHIFESFTREDSKRVHKTEGTGLGMAITKYIVDAMGGEIIVTSKQGEGTEFQVILDMERAEEKVEDMILPEWNMLVVDDDLQLCESAVDALKSIGLQADYVQDGESAIRTVMEHHARGTDYHVILLDWKLPGMDGIQTAREIRQQLGEDVPILLISAYDWGEIEEEARDAGISGFLMKPLFRSTLFYGLRPYAGISETPEVKENDEPEFSNKRVLVAEDNEMNWEIAYELLKNSGLELEWAENGQICVDMLRQSKPGYYDAILMDIRMPVMNGYEATDAIRALDHPDAKLPIIAMTADAYSEDIQRCMDHGMNAHVAKPIDIKEVTRALKRYLQD